ncbi:MAG TPA: LysM domain-containing protein [Ornithinimicrobium sp.]|nr:LysM domain-containing protein [Ornithinimicrobium sp.]
MQASLRYARAGLLLSAAGGAWAGLTALCLPVLARGASTPHDQLILGAAAATSVTATWLLVLLLAELVGALGPWRRTSARSTALPARAAVAAVVALALGSPSAAAADRTRLPAPDRAETPVPIASTLPPQREPVLVVKPGDSLWRLATVHLAPQPHHAAAVQRAVIKLYAANRGVIGADPDHIRPGTHLRVPGPHREERP